MRFGDGVAGIRRTLRGGRVCGAPTHMGGMVHAVSVRADAAQLSSRLFNIGGTGTVINGKSLIRTSGVAACERVGLAGGGKASSRVPVPGPVAYRTRLARSPRRGPRRFWEQMWPPRPRSDPFRARGWSCPRHW